MVGMMVSSTMTGFKLFVFTILFASTLISAVPHHQRIGGEDSLLDDEIQRDSLSQQLIRTKKSVDSSEIEDVAEKKVNNEIEKRSSQGSSALWAQTTLNDVEMDRQKNEEEAEDDAERSRRQYCNFRTYPIDGTLMSSYYARQDGDGDSSGSSSLSDSSSIMRSASTDDAQQESTLGNSAYSAKTFSLPLHQHQSLLPMVHQPITHGYDEALPIYKPVKQVVQQVIQPIQPVIQPVVHPVQPVIQPVYQQIEPIVKPPLYQPIYHTPMHLPAIHQTLPSIHQQHPLFPQHQLPMIPHQLHTPLCPCPSHLLGAARSADSSEGASAIQDQIQDSQQLQSIAMFRDASQLQQDGSNINGESSYFANII